MLADDEAVEKLIHPHLGGADLQTAMLDVAIDGIDFPGDLHLAVLIESVQDTAGGADRSGQDHGDEDGCGGAGFVAAAVHGVGSKSRATRSFALRARGFRDFSSGVGAIALRARSWNW